MTDSEHDSGRTAWPAWAWVLLLLAGAAAVAAFVGYGQSALLLEAVNLRYCG
jgi:hypothetical protein